MPKTYVPADADAVKLIARVLDKHHPDLKKAKVTVAALFVFPAQDEQTGEPKGPALSHHGWPALAIVRATTLKERARGWEDVEILIDGERWGELARDRQTALIDHELQHVEVRKNTANEFKHDDRNRPLLKLRQHDWEIGGFDAIVARHGDAAPEFRQACVLMAEERPTRQLLLKFA